MKLESLILTIIAMKPSIHFYLLPLLLASIGTAAETLPKLADDKAPKNFSEMWRGFDPRAEPLEVETLKEWEEEGVSLRIVRFRIGVFKGKKAKLAAIYGYPKNRPANKRVPGLLQIHGGGQYADHKACIANGRRGYATLSIAWAGRISSPHYRLSPAEVQLFWDGKTDDPRYKLTTDWGALDGYHAPSRNKGNVFPSAKAAAWTLDSIESPRNSGWFLCALAARRGLTFLERQPEIDPKRLGVYGHSMGGKLTVMTAFDSRVKAAAPSCGGISDLYNRSELFRQTIGDDVSLEQIKCPIIFLSPSNDFHGRIGDLPEAIKTIASSDWRVTCSPHHNHQDTPRYEVATSLWFDQYLKGTFVYPKTPETSLILKARDGVPKFTVKPDPSRSIQSVDVFYTYQGVPGRDPHENSMHRFWHLAKATEEDGVWTAKLPVHSIEKPLWVYANVNYPLQRPVTGAGYYYGYYRAISVNVSSLLRKATPEQLVAAHVRPALYPRPQIESFKGDWRKSWFTYRPREWSLTTHKLYDPIWKAPTAAQLTFEVQSAEANTLVIRIDDYAAGVSLKGGASWQTVRLRPQDFKDFGGTPFSDWNGIKRLKLSAAETLRPPRGSEEKPKQVGRAWKGTAPKFRNLRWVPGQN